jgi:xanthine dehydrogenase YagR molybdenum-binding subunit
LTCSAVEDFAAKAGLDPLEVFKLNLQYAPKARQDLYAFSSTRRRSWPNGRPTGSRAAKARDSEAGPRLGFSAWGGGGHASQCNVTLHADGSVQVDIGTQDLGTGTRTIITQVAAETLGLPMGAIKLASAPTICRPTADRAVPPQWAAFPLLPARPP